jgi:hypothetical protein
MEPIGLSFDNTALIFLSERLAVGDQAGSMGGDSCY